MYYFTIYKYISKLIRLLLCKINYYVNYVKKFFPHMCVEKCLKIRDFVNIKAKSVKKTSKKSKKMIYKKTSLCYNRFR